MKTMFISLVAISLLACNGSRQSGQRLGGEDGMTEPIVGRWKLFKTECCGRMKSTTYAEDKDQHIYLKFEEDGEVKKQEHGILLEKVPYTFESVMNDTVLDWVKIGDSPSAIYIIRNDTLILSWEYMDLQIEYYTRVR